MTPTKSTITPEGVAAEPEPDASPVVIEPLWWPALTTFGLTFIVVALGWALVTADGDRAGGEPTAEAGGVGAIEVPASVEQRQADRANDSVEFLAAWDRSLSGEYAVAGTLTRSAVPSSISLFGGDFSAGGPDDVQSVILPYRHARTATRELLQIGDTSLLVNAADGERTCVTRNEGILCTAPEGGGPDDSTQAPGRSDDLSNHRSAELAAVEQLVTSSSDGYRIHRIHPSEVVGTVSWPWPSAGDQADCWEARALGGDRGHRWGRRTEFCFDRSTGAAGFRRVFGPSRIETFLAQTITPVVTAGDLEPR